MHLVESVQEFEVVSCNDEGPLVFPGRVDHEFKDSPLVRGIKVAGWLIGKDEIRISAEGAADCHPLAFAVRKVAWSLFPVGGDSSAGCQLPSFRLDGLSLPAEAEMNGEKDVVSDGKVLDEFEFLEDESDPGQSESGRGSGGQGTDLDVIDSHGSRVRRENSRRQIEKGGLSATTWADNRDRLAGFADEAVNTQPVVAVWVAEFDVFDSEHWIQSGVSAGVPAGSDGGSGRFSRSLS